MMKVIGGILVDYSLLKEIEECREQMIYQSQTNDFTSKKVIEVSQQLDALLNMHAKKCASSSIN